MEARLGAEAHHFYGNNKRNLDWDLNDWKWDGDLFIATPVNRRVGKELFPLNSGVPAAGNSSNSSSSYSDEVDLGIERAKRELEKRRRVVVEDSNLNDDAGTLTLKLGGHGSSLVVGAREGGTWDGTSGKRGKVCNRAVCQVDGCAADLSNAKDYHRRHKVCEMHSKASKALVGNAMQRFCQQCSRFHVLQEFDEGKRSCRRRLAGHNKRRRKTNPETVVNGASLNDNQTSNYLLISLLRILSGMHSNRTDKAIDQNLVSHLVRSLANQSAEHGRTSEIISALLSNGPQDHPKPIDQHLPVSEMPQQHLHLDDIRDGEMRTTSSQTHSVLHSPPSSEARQTSSGETKINKFDLNDVYIDSDDCMDDIDRSLVPANIGTSSIDCPSWAQQDSHQSSPPQTSGNSDSASAQSPSSSTGDAQSRTDRIVFKLFGKEPNDFPLVLRAQILDWLSQSPTDIESYIRPGCIVLTIYLRQTDAAWEELCCDLSYSLSRLLDTGSDTFWRSGWIYARVQHQMAFIHEGQVAIDTSVVTNSNYCDILSVKPIAVSSCEKVQFSVKGINLSQPSTRLLCALEGRYLEPNAAHDFQDSDDSINDHDELQCVKLSCSIPEVIGRGFIEVEDNGLSSSFFPFIVAEEDVCAEIRMLEGALDITESETDNFESGEMKAKDQALEFIHEMGWLLHRTQLKPKLGHSIPKADLFSLKRFKWLMEFSMDHDWCAVVKKLLDVFLNGTVVPGEHPSTYMALSDMGLLHRAVRRNSRALVELLLRYVPQKDSKEPGSENNASVGEGYDTFLFRPDVAGPAGLTPLHIAAGKDGSEEVLDALTDDPGRVGVEAWKNTRDSTGFTPEDYARLRGQYSYIHLIQRKINKSTAGHVVLDIPDVPSDSNNKQKENTDLKASFEIGQPHMEPIKRNCNLCNKKFAYRTSNRSLVYRPAMLSMVAVAAVCVCVALLFKSSPEVLYVFEPFRWERLHYGTI